MRKMNSVKKLVLSVSLLSGIFISWNGFAGFVIVGNAGEGIMVDGRLYNRDLYDYDVHLNPWFGKNIDPRIEKNLKDWNPLALSNGQKDLLLRKLTDLKAIDPSFAYSVTVALTSFSWGYTSGPLSLIQPDEIRRGIRQEDRRPIANRLMQSILIGPENFGLLDDGNKIALILHEVVFTLLPLKLDLERYVRTQSISAARQITAGFFSRKILSSRHFQSMVLRETDFPAKKDAGEIVFPEDEALKVFVNPMFEEKPEADLILERGGTHEGRVERFCAGLYPERYEVTPQTITLRFIEESFRILEWDRYENPDGAPQYRLYMRVKYPKQDYDQVKSRTQCVNAISGYLERSFKPY